jgi:hypothetical protein
MSEKYWYVLVNTFPEPVRFKHKEDAINKAKELSKEYVGRTIEILEPVYEITTQITYSESVNDLINVKKDNVFIENDLVNHEIFGTGKVIKSYSNNFYKVFFSQCGYNEIVEEHELESI